MTARKLLLRTGLPPGDVIMLTAAVRDLHRCHPGRFLTDVRTSSPAIWEHNPWLTPLSSRGRGVEIIPCHYPLVDRSNEAPLHCLNGYAQFLAEKLGVPIEITEFKGDVHISSDETQWFSQVQEITGEDTPFWIIAAGGKHDYTIKWWDTARYQEVVDHFQGRILFVQVGSLTDHHPPLKGVIDLRGRTDLRQLIRLVYHSQGVLCPVTSLMHFAAAIETRSGRPPLRPCVVVAGGREPCHWEAYPGHQFLHTVGILPCCATGGCWRARTLPLGDGDPKDRLSELCEDVVNGLPHCMHLIDAAEVIRRIELYFAGGGTRYLAAEQRKVVERVLPRRHRSRGKPIRSSSARAGNGHGDLPVPVVTICVLTRDDRLELIRGCLEGIRRCGDRLSYRLVVGGNAVSKRVRDYLLRLQRSGFIDRLHLSPININRGPMMRRMFEGLETELVWWFDDDCHAFRRGALEWWIEAVRTAPEGTVAWGHEFPSRRADESCLRGDLRRLIRTASWYRGRPFLSRQKQRNEGTKGNGGVAEEGRRLFRPGGCWMIRTSALRALDWPDERLTGPDDGALLGEAIRQQGWKAVDVGSPGISRPRHRHTARQSGETGILRHGRSVH